MDYWVNGLGGEPFLVITQVINPGLVRVLREEIVSRLLREAPQPGEAVLEERAMGSNVVETGEGRRRSKRDPAFALSVAHSRNSSGQAGEEHG